MEVSILEYGKSLMSAIIKIFWNRSLSFAKEELADPPESETAFLWPYCCFIEMISIYYKTDSSVEDLYITTLNTIEKYKQSRTDGLTAYTAAYGGYEDAYYDDNGWAVKTFLSAYEIFRDKKWLDKACETIAYCYSGWDRKLGGGVYWRESDKLFKCLCSNAPLSLFSLELYKATGNEKYYRWALKLYKWAKSKFCDKDGLYLDGMFLNKKVDERKYPYNTAFMIQTELALSELTGNSEYLLSAGYSAKNSFPYFCSPGEDGKLKLKQFDRPWFYMCLLETYMKLYQVSSDKETVLEYIDYIAGEMIRAYQTCRNEDGFISPDWWTIGGPAPENIQIRDQSGMARIMFLLSDFYQTCEDEQNIKPVNTK